MLLQYSVNKVLCTALSPLGNWIKRVYQLLYQRVEQSSYGVSNTVISLSNTRDKVLELAKRIGVATAVHELGLYNCNFILGVASGGRACLLPNVGRNSRLKMPRSSVNWQNVRKGKPFSKSLRDTSLSD